MKVLLDENLDHRLRKHLGQHDVFTVSYMGWKGVKNGNLVQKAENEDFDVLITGDQSLYHEQNWTGKRLAIVVLSSVEWHITKHHLARILVTVSDAVPGSFQEVECGTFTRKTKETR